ncbi:protein of unknown function (plasmid) [Paraburkholderia kururiensis]
MRTENALRRAQIRIMLHTIMSDTLGFWQRAPHRTWNDISRLLLAQMATVDRLYPEAGVLDVPSRQTAVRFFARNADATITGFGRRTGDRPGPATLRLMEALRIPAHQEPQ